MSIVSRPDRSPGRCWFAFRRHYANEVAAKRPEYDAHQVLLDAFLKTTPPQ